MNIAKTILGSIETKMKILRDHNLIMEIERAGNIIIRALKRGNKILTAGNGGSAADAQHFVAELAGKFVTQRNGLPAEALTANSSIVTAIANDFGFENVFARQIAGQGRAGDVFFGISTSGNSKNIIRAMEAAVNQGIVTIGLLGNDGGKIKNYCDISLVVPSSNTQYIQESHIAIIHALCGIVDEACR